MKKLLGLCMALCLCLVLLPATALAANEATTVYVGNVELTGSKEKTRLRHDGRQRQCFTRWRNR